MVKAESSLENPIVLGIESSCDETGMALVQNGRILAESLASSMDEHKRFGGVIPEIASRAHVESLDSVYAELLEKIRVVKPEFKIEDISAIGVTGHPGLIGCLTVGASFAKGLALSLNKPIYDVDHIKAHILAAGLNPDLDKGLPDRFLGLIVSGGHSSLFLVENNLTSIVDGDKNGPKFTELGGTLDDAAGEAFDKVGRLLGLEYPAGPVIDKLAQEGTPCVDFPRPLTDPKFMDQHKYDFSFSGLKTAAVRFLQSKEATNISKQDFCASFAEAVADVLTIKTIWAAKEYHIDTIVIGGGFSANSQLRGRLKMVANSHKINLIAPPIRFCTDNGAMIANLTEKLYLSEVEENKLDFTVKSF
ncbi:MAG: tRNA (adenosine(37)-N6)-threonylcarbamoyltransferase complex transferase subunit TsaD [Candidatus Ancillula sp.]|nr:tRNA (adenosine(37)-N6)-threonylcarbamoyltransferase complex transferase subunit TsaD [Candidatus Ancillula sp.]